MTWPLIELAVMRRAVTRRTMTSPLTLEDSRAPSIFASVISTVPEMVLAVLTRPALRMRILPLIVLAPVAGTLIEASSHAGP